MQRKRQVDETGCGLACIAMLAGVSYEKVRNVAIEELGFAPDGEFYTGTGNLRELAARFGVKIHGKRQRKFKDWVHLPDTAIVAINPEGKNGNWHWVVFARRDCAAFVLDPKRSVKTNRRTDFQRMKKKHPVGFLPVTISIA